jgi:hypothetical protein
MGFLPMLLILASGYAGPLSLDHPAAAGLELTREELDRELSQQMALGGDSGAYFSFGSQEWHDAQFQTALSNAKEENAKMEGMKDALGEETFGMIQDQLLARGKKPMQAEKKSPQTLDGGSEDDLQRIEPFAIDTTSVSVGQFRAFVKATKYKTEAETFGWRARPAPPHPQTHAHASACLTQPHAGGGSGTRSSTRATWALGIEHGCVAELCA